MKNKASFHFSRNVVEEKTIKKPPHIAAMSIKLSTFA